MREKLYLTKDIAIINFDLAYPSSQEDFARSTTLANFMMNYLEFLEEDDKELYHWVLNGKTAREANVEIGKVLRLLLIMEPDELENYYLNDKRKLLMYIEGLYDFWKRHQRYSVKMSKAGHSIPFIAADSEFNKLVRTTYRKVEQKVQGRKNSVFRQLQAGTNAAITCYRHTAKLGEKYDVLNKVPFIESVMLRTPMILRPKSNKRTGMFEERDENPILTFTGNPDEFFAYPAKIGSLLVFIYFHRDFMSSGVSIGNLFELATPQECRRKPDAIVLFGNPDEKNECTFHYDEEEDLWVGSVSYHERIEYFGYMKKMSLTLHNLAMMKKGWLPIHGAFVSVTLKDGKHKNIMLMGDSGAGKSESIEALKALGNDVIKRVDVIFDDMGTIHIENGIPYGQGTEVGAFVRLDDLDAGTPYRDMDRSIFFNPDSTNARVITPAAPYDLVATNHRIDMLCYANNYDDKPGMHRFESLEEAKPVFVEGKRMAKGTTQEVGLSTTYFANPFGPMQKQEVCDPIIDTVFTCLEKNGVYIGEIYTHLGLDGDSREGINYAAEKLLEFIQKSF